MTASPERDPRSRVEALLALSADRPTPAAGPRPDALEIAAWHDGALDEARAAEVKSHVARDPELYAIWSDLVIAESVLENLDQAQPSQAPATRGGIWKSLLVWLTQQPLGLAGGGLVAAAAVLVLTVTLVSRPPAFDPYLAIEQSFQTLGDLPATSPDDWPFDGSYASKSIDFLTGKAVPVQPIYPAFGYGVRVGLANLHLEPTDEWQTIIAPFPETPPSCPAQGTDENCQARRELEKWVGQWSVSVYRRCTSARIGAAPESKQQWSEQKVTLEALTEKSWEIAPTSGLSLALGDLSKDWDSGIEPRCMGIRRLMREGLATVPP